MHTADFRKAFTETDICCNSTGFAVKSVIGLIVSVADDSAILKAKLLWKTVSSLLKMNFL